MEIQEILIMSGGFILMGVTFYDFFHTTLSGNGYWYISGSINKWLSRIILTNKSRSIFNFSGLIHLLVTTLCWLALLTGGAYLIFLSEENMVINGATKLPADLTERFYYTCFVLSTLGIGDFVPGNDLSRFLSGLISFSGFILLTTALAYLLSVITSLLDKKKLAFYIDTMGSDIEELYKFFTVDKNLSSFTEKSSDLRQLIISNSSNYLAFPVVNHFLTRKRNHAIEVQIASLYEVLMVLRSNYSEDSEQYVSISAVLRTIEHNLRMSLVHADGYEHDSEELYQLRSFWMKYGENYDQNEEKDRQIGASLHSAGWAWKDIFMFNKKFMGE
ncbi:ion channel [Salinimicrobium sp. GXAS 041]|uniref:ion channel n=1 Tax=Salinimicrobium sp. GXAS 041 TaxID=3400806 RepID=UPI003C796E23